jgi:hypothetical protein
VSAEGVCGEGVVQVCVDWGHSDNIVVGDLESVIFGLCGCI